MTKKPFAVQIHELTGKTIQRAWQGPGDYNSLDGGYDHDGPVTLEFTDGTSVVVEGAWCNDGTASTDYETGTWVNTSDEPERESNARGPDDRPEDLRSA